MSRIFEALQRADLERKATSAPEVELFPEPTVISELEEPFPAKDDSAQDAPADAPAQYEKDEKILEDVVRHPWTPTIASFPTLADHGSGVEQFRSLRSRIYQARYEGPLKASLISSGLPSEGKTFVV